MKTLKELITDLQNYPARGVFDFSPYDALSKVCNIPVNKYYSGIYLFYTDTGELIYVGISGREGVNGEIIHRRDGLRGRFLTGKQFGDRRCKTLPIQMEMEKILRLTIHWFVTYGNSSKNIPRSLESIIIETFKKENDGKRPRWNRRD